MRMRDFLADEAGQGIVEYGLIIGLIAVALIGTIMLFTPAVERVYGNTNTEISEALSAEAG